MKCFTIALLLVHAAATAALAANVTGDPSADTGWALAGHSLAQGTHAKGSANYGYDAYGAGFAIAANSNLQITDTNDTSLSWLVGDTVLGVGGKFRSITAAEAGWASITGGAINGLLPTTSPHSGPKLQAKFGTSDATWYASTTAPNGGNGNSSSSSGGGRVQVRSSAYFQSGTPHPDQELSAPWTWDGHSGQVLVLEEDGHIAWDGPITPDKHVARMIWQWDTNANRLSSWQLLLNVSLLERLAPDNYNGLFPAVGDMAVMTVQDNNSSYTDALVTTVPEPATLSVMALMGLATLRRRKHR